MCRKHISLTAEESEKVKEAQLMADIARNVEKQALDYLDYHRQVDI